MSNSNAITKTIIDQFPRALRLTSQIAPHDDEHKKKKRRSTRVVRKNEPCVWALGCVQCNASVHTLSHTANEEQVAPKREKTFVNETFNNKLILSHRHFFTFLLEPWRIRFVRTLNEYLSRSKKSDLFISNDA